MKIFIKRKSITKTVQLKFRCTEEEMKKLEKTARSHNLTVQEYIEKLLHNDIQIDLRSRLDSIQDMLRKMMSMNTKICQKSELNGYFLSKFILIYFSVLEFASKYQVTTSILRYIDKSYAEFVKKIADSYEIGEKSDNDKIYNENIKK